MTVKREVKPAADITEDEADKLKLHNHRPDRVKVKGKKK